MMEVLKFLAAAAANLPDLMGVAMQHPVFWGWLAAGGGIAALLND